VLASVHEHTELILDSFWNVQPMELGVHETRQTAVEFSGVTDNSRGCIQHSGMNSSIRTVKNSGVLVNWFVNVSVSL